MRGPQEKGFCWFIAIPCVGLMQTDKNGPGITVDWIFTRSKTYLGKSTINIFESSHQIGQGRNKETFRKPLDLLGGNLYGKSVDQQLVQELQGVKPGLKQRPTVTIGALAVTRANIRYWFSVHTPNINQESTIVNPTGKKHSKQTFFRGPHWFWAGSPLSIIQTCLVALINPMDYHNCPHRKGYYF